MQETQIKFVCQGFLKRAYRITEQKLKFVFINLSKTKTLVDTIGYYY